MYSNLHQRVVQESLGRMTGRHSHIHTPMQSLCAPFRMTTYIFTVKRGFQLMCWTCVQIEERPKILIPSWVHVVMVALPCTTFAWSAWQSAPRCLPHQGASSTQHRYVSQNGLLTRLCTWFNTATVVDPSARCMSQCMSQENAKNGAWCYVLLCCRSHYPMFSGF